MWIDTNPTISKQGLTDDIHITPRIPAMESMADANAAQKDENLKEIDSKMMRTIKS
jgi:hypothetical protein